MGSRIRVFQLCSEQTAFINNKDLGISVVLGGNGSGKDFTGYYKMVK